MLRTIRGFFILKLHYLALVLLGFSTIVSAKDEMKFMFETVDYRYYLNRDTVYGVWVNHDGNGKSLSLVTVNGRGKKAGESNNYLVNVKCKTKEVAFSDIRLSSGTLEYQKPKKNSPIATILEFICDQ